MVLICNIFFSSELFRQLCTILNLLWKLHYCLCPFWLVFIRHTVGGILDHSPPPLSYKEDTKNEVVLVHVTMPAILQQAFSYSLVYHLIFHERVWQHWSSIKLFLWGWDTTPVVASNKRFWFIGLIMGNNLDTWFFCLNTDLWPSFAAFLGSLFFSITTGASDELKQFYKLKCIFKWDSTLYS